MTQPDSQPYKPPRSLRWIGRVLCKLGFHDFHGTAIPHTYECVRPGCPAVEAGYP